MRIVMAIIVILAVLYACDQITTPANVQDSGTIPVAASRPDCTPDMFDVQLQRGEWVDECRLTPCPVFRGTATVRNGCPHPSGVELKAILIDSAGNPLQVRTFWPESTRNLPVGETVVSLDQVVDHQPGAASLTVQPVDVRRW